MSLEICWPLLQQESRDWLVANNGDALSTLVLDDLARVGGPVPSGAWWVGESGPAGFYLSDAGIDWIEAVAKWRAAGPSAGALTLTTTAGRGELSLARRRGFRGLRAIAVPYGRV